MTTQTDDITEVFCGKCGEKLGERVVIDGFMFLDSGAVLVHSQHGVCKKCKTEFHFNSGTKAMNDLVRHVKEMRSKNQS